MVATSTALIIAAATVAASTAYSVSQQPSGGGGNIPPVTEEERAMQASTAEATQTQSDLMKKQIEQMDMQLQEQKEMNDTIDKYIADSKAEQEALAKDPEYQARIQMENELIDKQLKNALGLTVLTPEETAEIDALWNTSKEAAQVQINRSYDDLTAKIQSGKAEDLATIDTDYADLLRKIDREIPEKTKETYRTVSPLMRNSATLENTMTNLATEISRVKEDLIMSQGAAKTNVTRRATESTTTAATEKARAEEQLAKETEAGKLGAYEAKKASLGAGYSSLPPYYTTGLENQKQATELQTALLPYQTKLGVSQNIATNFATPINTATNLGATSLNAANSLYTQRYQPWQTGATLDTQSSIAAYNQRMALLGATISAGSRLGAAYYVGKTAAS